MRRVAARYFRLVQNGRLELIVRTILGLGLHVRRRFDLNALRRQFNLGPAHAGGTRMRQGLCIRGGGERRVWFGLCPTQDVRRKPKISDFRRKVQALIAVESNPVVRSDLTTPRHRTDIPGSKRPPNRAISADHEVRHS